MLQISQIEKPRCSATIDQIRFRRAICLPVESQNFSSSGCHSEIQVVSRVLIGDRPFPVKIGSNGGGSTARAVCAEGRTPLSGEGKAGAALAGEAARH